MIHNPAAGSRKAARFGRLLNALVAEGCLVEVLRTAARGDAEAFARGARGGDWDVLVVAGGDGTVNEVVNGLGEDAPPLAIVPMGTANVAARELRMPSAPEAVARVITESRVAEVFAGVANGRRFLAMAGVGFDALVVEAVNARLKRLIGRGAYALEIVRQLVRFTGGRYAVTIDGRTYEAASVVLAKARFYGGRFVCAPAASLAEPALHVCLFGRSGRAAALRYIAGLVLGLLPRMGDVMVVPATRVTVRGSTAGPVQGDGDVIARLPLDAGIWPTPIRVVAPGSWTAAFSRSPDATLLRRPC
jgi:diacylglycerol kinase (ATP)